MKGKDSAGLQYEKEVGKLLTPESKHGVWWFYQDNGIGYTRQTDYTFNSSGNVVVIECKLSWSETALCSVSYETKSYWYIGL